MPTTEAGAHASGRAKPVTEAQTRTLEPRAVVPEETARAFGAEREAERPEDGSTRVTVRVSKVNARVVPSL